MKSTLDLWKIAFTFLLIAGVLGLVLRLHFINPLDGVNYQFVLHGHSHVVLLGWVFNALVAAVHIMLFGNEISKRYKILYWLFQISVLGMLISFPLQGYAFVSIFFSTLHILLSYVWVVWTWKKSKNLEKNVAPFVRWGLFYLIIATLGPFSLGPIIATGGVGSDLYFMAIYYYLHFLYNGFFIFMLLGMFFWLLKKRELNINSEGQEKFINLMNVSCILTLFLSALWMQPETYVYLIGAVAGIIQLLAIGQLWGIVRPVWKDFLKQMNREARLLIGVVLIGLLLKVTLQALSALPVVADLAYAVRNYIIGYLHLVFIGIVTPFLFTWFNERGMIDLQSKVKKVGLIFFLIGFIASEFVMVTPSLWGINYFKLLFGVSFVLWTGFVLIRPSKSGLT